MFITLDANQARVEQDRADYAALLSKDIKERAAARGNFLKEVASGDADITRVSLSEGRFIDLAIRKDSFLDDAAIRTSVTAETPLVWKSRYEPPVGVTTGSVYGGGTSTSYAVQDNHAFVNTFVADVQSVKLPTMALTQDVRKLGLRDAGLKRQAEALKLKQETFLANIMMDQPIGTDLATTVTNYWNASNSYGGKTVYVADPGVQSGTYEVSNLIDCSAEHGLTPAVFEALMVQEQKTGLTVRTLHIPKKGFPFRKLLRAATIVATTSVLGAGQMPNANLAAIPAEEWAKMHKTDWNAALADGLIIEIFGRRYKIKANNVLPEGFAIVTTNEPAAEIFDIVDRSVDTDIDDPKEPYFQEHYSKRVQGIAVPHPWVRNFFVLNMGTTVLA